LILPRFDGGIFAAAPEPFGSLVLFIYFPFFSFFRPEIVFGIS
jgi:hypothetical protein